MRGDQLFVLLNIFMWNYYAYGFTSCDCAKLWWPRKMELDFVAGEEGVERSSEVHSTILETSIVIKL